MGKWNNKAAEDSAQILKQITIPVLKKYFNGEVISTEINNDFAKLLDQHAASDAILVKDELLFGIAHRVEYKNKQSITVRYKNSETTKPSEYQKITNPLTIKPAYHVTTCCVEGKPKFIAIIATNALLQAITDGIGELVTGKDGSQYFELKWHDLREYGIKVLKVKLNYEEV